MYLRETLQVQSAKGWCSQRGTLQTQMSNEAKDRLAPSELNSFSGAVRAASYEFPSASEEEPRRKIGVRSRILLPRPGVPASGHYRPKEPRTGVSRREHCRPTNVQRGYRRVGTVGFCNFSGAVKAGSRFFPPTNEEDPRRETTGADSRRAREAWCSRTGILQAQIPTRLLTLSRILHKVVLFWQPPSYFPP